ncbi:MAG: sugar kinase [Dorea sp.]|jgi:sugar/nucleoside kinase (ribokinase family)|nr:sugar kinase [Dorea sp.]
MSEIIIIGAAVIDILARPASAAVFETGSYATEDIRMALGGDALNEALILSRMGKKVCLETVIGDDHAGRFIAAQCRKNGIMIEERQIRSDFPTGINVVLVGEDGERSFLTNPSGSLRRLTVDDICMPFDKKAKILCFASIFVFPKIRTEQLAYIFSQAKRQGIIVCADMTKCKNNETVPDMAKAFSYIDYLFANEAEASLLTGETDMKKAAGALLLSGVKHVIIKRGKKGCFVKTDSKEYQIPAKEAVCIDTTGAGDSFTAGFIYALSKGETLEHCARFANECGAKAVSVLGAAEWIIAK